ncbi:MAG: IS66 family transposase [Bacteroidia bacterium]|nr:IS66 family transposase [Bacteroidia bacterium]
MSQAEEIALLREENQALKARVVYLEAELSNLKKWIFGSKTERFVPAEQEAPAEKEQISYERKKPRKQEEDKQKPQRMPLPAHLPRIEHYLRPDEPTDGLLCIGQQITEELEYEPGKLYVNRYIRPKYRRERADESVQILVAPLPSRPIEKGIPGPGLLAHLVISKYLDHLPLYRQNEIFKRQEVSIASSTLSDWVAWVATLLMPLYERLKSRILASAYMQADESPIKVLDSTKKGKTHQGYYWLYYSPPEALVLFEYHPGRSQEAARAMLGSYQGWLQTDGYTVYEAFENQPGVRLLACMAHARRKFVEARANDPARTEEALRRIQLLYELEAELKEQNTDEPTTAQLRQQKALPILEDMQDWLTKQQSQVLPKSKIGDAIQYFLNRTDRLKAYCQDGKLQIDNNLIENAIRPLALGRKNYLFAGSHEAAQRAAVIYSLLGTAKRQGLDPADWLKKTLSRINDHPINKIEELLPLKTGAAP